MTRFVLSWSAVLVFGGAFVTSTAQAQRLLAPAGPAALTHSVQFDVFLPLQHTDELDQLLQEQKTPGSANYQKWLTPAEFRARFGPSATDLATLTDTLKFYGLTVTSTHSHGVKVQGTVAATQRAFGVALSNAFESNGSNRIIAAQGLTLPAALQRMGAQVVSFAPLPQLQPHARIAKAAPANRYSAQGPYWFNDLKQAYDFPSYRSLTGAGRVIAIMAVSQYLPSDITAYFAHESTKSAPIAPPTIIPFPIGGGSPAFNVNSGASLEVNLDIEQAGGMAPGATLVVVNLPDASDGSFIDGYLTLVEDNFADIVNTSFGGPEALYTAAYNGGVDFTGILRVFDDVFKQGNAEGITFVESSGDNGGLPVPPIAYFTTPPQTPPIVVGKFLPGVESYGDSPNVTSVGGTNLATTYDPPSLDSAYVSENAFDDTEVPYDPYGYGNLVAGGVWGSGGGKSVIFAKPPYQDFVNTHSSTRAMPDISLQMGGCPAGIAKSCNSTDSAVVETFGGALVGVIGTSISAPDFAGVLALKEQYLNGRLGNVNYDIYAIAAAEPGVGGTPFNLLHQGQPGSNGAFSTTASGYNLVLGVGTPLVKNFIFAPQLPAAGVPRTPSNP